MPAVTPPGVAPLVRRPTSAGVVEIHPVMAADLPAITEIQAERIRGGAPAPVAAPLDLRQVTAMRERLAARGCPCLVATRDGTVAGFAFAQPFAEREAWAGTVEGVIASRAHLIGTGVGALLLEALVAACAARGFRQMIAVLPAEEAGPQAMHAAQGFVQAGLLRGIGLALGAPVDCVLMQRPLAAAPRHCAA